MYLGSNPSPPARFMKKILVVGGSGFIGLHLIELLNSLKKYSVAIYDLKEPKFTNFKVKLIKGDVLDYQRLAQAVKENDIIVGLDGLLGTNETFDNILEVAKINILGAINVFEASRLYNKKVIYLSLTNNWLNPYTITKQAGNKFAQMYFHQFGTKIAVLRGLNVYGEYQKYNRVKKIIPQFAVKALLGEPVVIYGNGEQKVDLIDAKDVARAIIMAMENSKAYGQVIDIGTGKAKRVIDVANLVIKLAKSKSKILFKPVRRGEPKDSITVADTKLALSILGFKPKTSLEEGLGRTIDWY